WERPFSAGCRAGAESRSDAWGYAWTGPPWGRDQSVYIRIQKQAKKEEWERKKVIRPRQPGCRVLRAGAWGAKKTYCSQLRLQKSLYRLVRRPRRGQRN